MGLFNPIPVIIKYNIIMRHELNVEVVWSYYFSGDLKICQLGAWDMNMNKLQLIILFIFSYQ